MEADLYVLIIWPFSQEYMEYDWFEEEAILDSECKNGSAAYFIPKERYDEVKANKTISIEKFARLDSVTGKGINEAYVFGACEDIYIADEEEALKKCKELGYDSLEASYEDGNHYWTTWSEDDIDEDDEWYDADGNVYNN